METPVVNHTDTNAPRIPNRKSRAEGIEGTRLPGGVAIDVRKMDFKEAMTGPVYGYRNDPITSHFFFTLSLLFPAGELFFMDSVRNYKKAISDPVLKQQVKAFLSQEALHTKEHVNYNKRLEELGIDVDRIHALLDKGFNAMKRYIPKKDQLAMTALMEHFTATLADDVLKNEKAHTMMDASIRRMWLWHAVEETEHKAVAFDVYRAVGGGEVRRLLAAPYTVITVGPMLVGTFLYLVAADGQLTNGRSWRRLGDTLFGRNPGILRRTAGRLWSYRRMGFHPWHHDNYKRIQAWKAQFAGQYAVV